MTGAEILLDRFDALIDTPEAVERLRQFVLDLAVRGKLVAQDPADEPAEALLRRIAEKKRQRYEAGEIRKPKKLKPIREAERPFEIPAGWAWARFGQVAEIASNLEDPTLSPDLPHVAPNHIEKDTGRLLPYGTIGEDGVTSNKHRFYPGQILYSKIRPNLNKAVTVDFEGLCSADMYPLEPYVDTAYLHRFILSASFVRQVVSDDNRLAMPKVNQTQLQSVAVAVPPLSEQRRIVARVDELMALCDRLADGLARRDALRQRWAASTVRHVTEDAPIAGAPAWSFAEDHLDTLLADPEAVPLVRRMVLDLAVRGRLTEQDPADEPAEALLQRIAEEKRRRHEAGEIRKPKKSKAVSEAERLFRLPDGWTWTRLSTICTYIQRGRQPKYVDSSDVPVISQKCVQWDRFAFERARFIDESTLDKYRDERFLQDSDLLWNSTGLGTLGRVGIFPGEEVPYELVVADSHVTVIRPTINDDALPRYLLAWFSSPSVQDVIESESSGSTKQAELATGTVRNYPVPLPPVEEQRRIVARVDELVALCDRLADGLGESRTATERLLANALVSV